MISIIMVNHKGSRFTLNSIASLKSHPPSIEHEVIVVDNGSGPEEQDQLKRNLPGCRIIALDSNRGFGAANNKGAAAAKGDVLFFVNNDTLFTEDATWILNDELKKERTGIVAPGLRNEDGTFQRSFGGFPSLMNEYRARRDAERFKGGPFPSGSVFPSEPDWVTGAAMMIRRSVFEQVGGFDESYFMYFEDVDLCRRIRSAGFTILVRNDVSLIHLGGRSYSRGQGNIELEYRRSQLRYYDKFQNVPQRILIRVYLLMKFLARLPMNPEGAGRSMALVFRRHANP